MAKIRATNIGILAFDWKSSKCEVKSRKEISKNSLFIRFTILLKFFDAQYTSSLIWYYIKISNNLLLKISIFAKVLIDSKGRKRIKFFLAYFSASSFEWIACFLFTFDIYCVKTFMMFKWIVDAHLVHLFHILYNQYI